MILDLEKRREKKKNLWAGMGKSGYVSWICWSSLEHLPKSCTCASVSWGSANYGSWPKSCMLLVFVNKVLLNIPMPVYIYIWLLHTIKAELSSCNTNYIAYKAQNISYDPKQKKFYWLLFYNKRGICISTTFWSTIFCSHHILTRTSSLTWQYYC